VYCAWALLLPAPLAGGVALGVCVHFIASSGLAKLHVAAAGKGVRAGAAAWCLIRVRDRVRVRVRVGLG